MNLNPFIHLVSNVLTLYMWALFIYIIIGWLIYFQIINPYQKFVRTVYEFLRRLIDPVLGYLRKYIPPMGGLDISPIVLILLIYFIQDVLYSYFYHYG